MIWRDRLDRPLSTASTADPGEVARFAAIAEEWWDPDGRFATLHQLNPVRLAFIRARVARLRGRDPATDLPFAGLRVLDIGCGGGLLSEPAAFLGARVVGIDATAKLIEVAKTHAALIGIDIDYRHALAEDLASASERFDVNLATLRGWPIAMVVVDIAWGTFLTAISATAGFLATQRLFPASGAS